MSDLSCLVVWSDSLRIGLDEVDAQHRTLVDFLNEFFRAMLELRGQEALAQILFRMNNYTGEHFSFEESCMRQLGYPDLDRHRAEHQAYVDYVEGLHHRMASGDFISSLEVVQYLRDWLTKHILTLDLDFGRWAGSGGDL